MGFGGVAMWMGNASSTSTPGPGLPADLLQLPALAVSGGSRSLKALPFGEDMSIGRL